MTWVLVLILLIGSEVRVDKLGEYDTMVSCFEERETQVERLGRPITGYQVICVSKPR
jgi:hypothetical protein